MSQKLKDIEIRSNSLLNEKLDIEIKLGKLKKSNMHRDPEIINSIKLEKQLDNNKVAIMNRNKYSKKLLLKKESNFFLQKFQLIQIHSLFANFFSKNRAVLKDDGLSKNYLEEFPKLDYESRLQEELESLYRQKLYLVTETNKIVKINEEKMDSRERDMITDNEELNYFKIDFLTGRRSFDGVRNRSKRSPPIYHANKNRLKNKSLNSSLSLLRNKKHNKTRSQDILSKKKLIRFT